MFSVGLASGLSDYDPYKCGHLTSTFGLAYILFFIGLMCLGIVMVMYRTCFCQHRPVRWLPVSQVEQADQQHFIQIQQPGLNPQ
jgi:hypothetical protein